MNEPELTQQLKSFIEKEKSGIADCLRGTAYEYESTPDIPGISEPDYLKEQFYDSIGRPCRYDDFEDGIDTAGGV